MKGIIDENNKLEGKPVLHWKPVQVTEHELHMHLYR